MLRYLAGYGATLLAMGGLDYLWLSNTSGPLYRKALGDLMAKEPDMRAAVIFYLLYGAGLVWFAVRPALEEMDWRTATLNGALFGFFAYATYDLTNLATLKNWPLQITLIDMVWGAVLSSVAGTIGALAALQIAER